MKRIAAAMLALVLATGADLSTPDLTATHVSVTGYADTLSDPSAAARGASARIKDIAAIAASRENQLVGYGLVVGLSGTGDSARSAPFMGRSLDAMLTRLGIASSDGRAQVRNVAAVVVTGHLPAFAQPGARADITVSSIGDASSLRGGTLVMTQLSAADGDVYAVAQGSVLVSGFLAQGNAETVQAGVPTVGRVPGGALIERAPPAPLQSDGYVLQLRHADFSTAVAMADAINAFATARYNVRTASAEDARTVLLTRPANVSPARFLAHIENLTVATDVPARAVVDQRNGTIVIGADMRVSRVAVSQGTLVVRVTETPRVVQPEPFSKGITAVEPSTAIDAAQSGGSLNELDGTDLQTLVDGLNALGVTPSDTIAILQAVDRAGALQGELVVQ
ncbi:flagellar basal body P-ring protein FlgI [Rhizobiaceae bacterium]|nr:flagellar basal body P-ring protein FlgI [Rhizobiaceae bacterium]